MFIYAVDSNKWILLLSSCELMFQITEPIHLVKFAAGLKEFIMQNAFFKTVTKTNPSTFSSRPTWDYYKAKG